MGNITTMKKVCSDTELGSENGSVPPLLIVACSCWNGPGHMVAAVKGLDPHSTARSSHNRNTVSVVAGGVCVCVSGSRE